MRTLIAALVVSCLLPAAAAAQGAIKPTNYPTKPVTIVVPAAPGGGDPRESATETPRRARAAPSGHSQWDRMGGKGEMVR